MFGQVIGFWVVLLVVYDYCCVMLNSNKTMLNSSKTMLNSNKMKPLTLTFNAKKLSFPTKTKREVAKQVQPSQKIEQKQLHQGQKHSPEHKDQLPEQITTPSQNIDAELEQIEQSPIERPIIPQQPQPIQKLPIRLNTQTPTDALMRVKGQLHSMRNGNYARYNSLIIQLRKINQNVTAH